MVARLADDSGLGEYGNACGTSADGVPCFSVTTVKRRPQWATSIRQLLGTLGPEDSPSPSRPPTLKELEPYRPGPVGPVAILVSFDPTCVGKSVLKRLKGRNDTYYLYRVRDAHGERVELHDHRLTAETFQGGLEFLGKVGGECQAVAAFRHEEQKGRPRLSATTGLLPKTTIDQ